MIKSLKLVSCLALLCLSQAHALKVIVTFQPLYDVVSRVAGDAAQVERAAPIGASPHTFDPTVRDIRRIKEADLAVMAGLGADAWMKKYVRASGSKASVLSLGDQMNFAKIKVGNATDPHWWLDVSLMASAARLIGETLAQKDPVHAALYRGNAEKEAIALMKLHTDLKSTLSPIKGGKIVTFHNAFGYFARAYGLEVAATIAPMHDVEPSVQSIANAVRIIRSAGVKAVFAEPQLPLAAAKTVATEAGVALHTLDPEGSAQAPAYTDMMRFNRDSLLTAFGR